MTSFSFFSCKLSKSVKSQHVIRPPVRFFSLLALKHSTATVALPRSAGLRGESSSASRQPFAFDVVSSLTPTSRLPLLQNSKIPSKAQAKRKQGLFRPPVTAIPASSRSLCGLAIHLLVSDNIWGGLLSLWKSLHSLFGSLRSVQPWGMGSHPKYDALREMMSGWASAPYLLAACCMRAELFLGSFIDSQSNHGLGSIRVSRTSAMVHASGRKSTI